MADAESRKKYAILSVSSVILVAMVVAVTVGTRNAGTESHEDELSGSQKAVQSICAPTDYKETCVNSLSKSNSSDPKELIVEAFKVTVDYLREAAENSTVLNKLEEDPRSKIALDNCKELAERAVDDLEKSFDRFDTFDFSNFDALLSDIQVWLSGAITHQETCLDGFQNTTGEAGEKMRKALNTSMELTSNGLAMINDISSILSTMDVAPLTSRRLLSEEAMGHGTGDFPAWINEGKRRLLQATPRTIQPDLIVAKDGSGKYRTINEALLDIPEKSNKTFLLYIKEGVYEEKVTFGKHLLHLMVIGDGPTKTRITGRLNFIDGTPTYHTATVAVLGDFFIAKDIGFENSAGADKHQAVALRVQADKVIFYNCHMDGYQDTLYAHTYRQYYRNCKITGTIDFVFGDAAAILQNCTLEVRKPLENQQCIVTAQGRKDIRQPTGLIVQNCSFVAAPEYFPLRFQLKSYLGRPWKEFSRTIIVESFIDDLIQPEGWLPWMEDFGLQTLFYSEFNNRGPGSNKNLRVKWPGVKELPPSRIERFLAANFVEGNTWVRPTGVPYSPSFIFPPPKEDPQIKYSPVAPEETKDIGKPKQKEEYKLAPEAGSGNSNNSGPKSEHESDSGPNSEHESGSGSASGIDFGSASGSDGNPIFMSPAGAPDPSPRNYISLPPSAGGPAAAQAPAAGVSWITDKFWS